MHGGEVSKVGNDELKCSFVQGMLLSVSRHTIAPETCGGERWGAHVPILTGSTNLDDAATANLEVYLIACAYTAILGRLLCPQNLRSAYF